MWTVRLYNKLYTLEFLIPLKQDELEICIDENYN